MDNLMKFLKKNKNTVVVVICCLILTIFVFAVKLTLFPNEAKAIYGNRLDGISKVKIKDSDLEQVENTLGEKEEVEEIGTSVSGRVINVLITVKDDTSRDTVKGYVDEIDKAFDNDQKDFYDIQMFVSKKGEDATFPIVAYRHKGENAFSFTKDR